MNDKMKPLPWSEIFLRPIDHLDPETLKVWQNNPDIRDRAMGFRFPVATTQVASWMEAKATRSGKSEASFSVFRQDIGVGASFLTGIDWVNRSANFGLYIGDKRAHGQGIGYCASALTLDYGFNALGLFRIGLQVIENNTGAIRLYERLGMTHEGRLRAAVQYDGNRKDVLLYGICAPDWNAIPNTANRLVAQL